MRDAIRALQPRFVIIENVPGIASKMGSRPGESALGTVVADLAEAGYVGSWIRLRASDVGAPHKRERVFVIATHAERLRVDADSGVRRGSSEELGRSPQEAVSAGAQVALAEDAVADSPGVATYTKRERQYRLGGSDEEGETGVWEDRRPILEGSPSPAADPDGRGFASVRESDLAGFEGSSGDVTDRRDQGGPAAADADSERREEHRGTISGTEALAAADGDNEGREWGIYAPAIVRWEGELGRSAPRPTDDRGRLSPNFVEWMLGFPDGWTEEETRTQRLRMLGNAVQVQCGEVIGGMILGS